MSDKCAWQYDKTTDSNLYNKFQTEGKCNLFLTDKLSGVCP